MKYNAVLRGLDSPVEFLRNQFQTICCGNPYCTTLHVINSLIVKTSKLTRAGPVYRGMSGRVLPETFLKPNAHNVRGGVEAAFMSTTTDREVAMSYAANAQTAGIVFEIQQGMVDRGADIAWCSQARLPPFPATPPRHLPPPAVPRRLPPPPGPASFLAWRSSTRTRRRCSLRRSPVLRCKARALSSRCCWSQ